MTKTNKIKEINLENIKRRKKHSKVISFRTTQEISEWMAKNGISPTKLFNECAQILMQEDE